MAKIGDVMEGLKILLKYYPDGDVCAEHDIVYAGDGPDNGKKVNKEDRKTLEELGWHIDSETESWSHFT